MYYSVLITIDISESSTFLFLFGYLTFGVYLCDLCCGVVGIIFVIGLCGYCDVLLASVFLFT